MAALYLSRSQKKIKQLMQWNAEDSLLNT